ncbi:CinA family protein [Sediminivirga luteola]|uniref:CinA family protein n=1 Tax=Sediminivirga luteola TaxID=1774748 RepID=UPI001F594E87|nr:CinA family protein [Sediminivirga luteola]MCI2266391.1 CinA family protein [Sediminivirga luteola]
MSGRPGGQAAGVLETLGGRGLSLGVAESLTGGLLAARIVAVPGASAVFRGGVVSYATDLKHAILGVEASLLASRGAVDPDVARAMARGARHVLGADLALATTGVAGPEPQDGQPVGRVFVAVAGLLAPGTDAGEWVRRLDLGGNRQQIREAAVTAALELLVGLLAGEPRLAE